MRKLRYIFFSIFSFFLLFSAEGQTIYKETIDTLYLNRYKGKINYHYKRIDEERIPHGKVSFVSSLFRDPIDRNIKKVTFDGSYLQGLKDGAWIFKETTYSIELNDILDRRGVFTVDYDLSGKEKQFQLNFKGGVPDGQWVFRRSNIEDGRKRPQINTGELNFKDGIGVGKVRYVNQDKNIKMSFQLNESGFIDGRMGLSYPDSIAGKIIDEIRYYDDGFLLRIEKFYENSRAPFHIVIFEDIITKLDSIAQFPNDVNYKVSDGDGFGLLFDNGYVIEEDIEEKINTQKTGNDIIESFLNYFQSFIDEEQEHFQSPKFHFTKRIKYFYPEEEKEILMNLKEDLSELCASYEDFINEPRNKLYKSKSKRLSEAMAFIQLASEKCNIIEMEIDRFLSGEFDYKYRPNFFRNGIEGLNQKDTLFYKFQSDTIYFVFDVGVLISDNQSIVEKMNDYFYKMKAKTAEYKLVAQDRIQLFKQQDEIDFLDREIVVLQDVSDSLFGSMENLRKMSFDNLKFPEKIYFVFQNELLLGLKDKYLEADSYEKKKELGEQLSCFLKVVNDEFQRLEVIGHNRNALDSLFTVFEDNPFDDRKFESRILGNVREKGGETLFRYYIEDLLKTTDCDKISMKIDRLEMLFKRLEKLALTHNKEETIRINRLVRRESVPNRIERVLGLSDDN
jgi:hypothetical protein